MLMSGNTVQSIITPATMTGRARLLAAANRQPGDVTPVWFMRQAGRCLPEYRAMREQYPFLTMARTPELAVEATLMPVNRFGVDGAVLFADIMLPLDGMGIDYEIRPGVGPVIAHPIRTAEDIERIRIVDAEEGTPYVLEALRQLRAALGDRAAALGFAGAPFTLACYLVDGRPSREYPKTKALMYGRPDLWGQLMTKLTEVTVRYLEGQTRAGADAIQLFDSWLGLVDPVTYADRIAPYTARIFSRLRDIVPTIHFSTGTVQLLPEIAATGPAMVSVDWRLPLDRAWEVIGPEIGIQGNLDPTLLMAPWDVVEAGARDILTRANGRPGHIFNLGHGLLPETDPDQLTRLVELVHAETGSLA
jgi:uroporphyrinogen decarboxylase